MARQTITFVLDTERDRDVLSWLDRQENKSMAIREAIRANLHPVDITLVDIYEAIQDLKTRTCTSAGAVSARGVEDSSEPPDVAAALDNLGL